MDSLDILSEGTAFVTTFCHCCTHSTLRESAFTCRRRPFPSKSTRRVARRQRLRATATPPKPSGSGEEKPNDEEHPKDETTEKEEKKEVLSAEDVEASDLTLPNLRELYAGAGKPGCEQCDGKGEIPCPVCDAKGFVSLTMMDTTSSAQCRMCRGQRIIPCPTCREMVYKSVLWWDQIPSTEEDPNEDWRQGPDGPKISWGEPPAGP